MISHIHSRWCLFGFLFCVSLLFSASAIAQGDSSAPEDDGSGEIAETPDPISFKQAYGQAMYMVQGIGIMRDGVKNAKGDKARKIARNELFTHLDETARILKIAVNFSKEPPDDEGEFNQEQVNATYYLLSYIYLLRERFYEAAIAGEHVAQHGKEKSPKMAQEAAVYAFTAYAQTFNESDVKSRAFDLLSAERIANLIAKNWPKSAEADRVRMSLGQLYLTAGHSSKAADAWSKVPKSSEFYTQAQLSSGRALYKSYAEAANAAGNDENRKAAANKLRDSAAASLKTGIQNSEAKLKEAKKPATPELIAAKYSLALIHNARGEYGQVVSILNAQPFAVKAAVDVKPGAKRPKSGLKSESFAGAVYRLLLRAYVGNGDLDKAKVTLNEIEKLSSAGGGLAAIYMKLGRELEKEIKQLREDGETGKLKKVTSSFESLLDSIGEKKEELNYSSMRWLAEMYLALAEGGEEGSKKSKAYFAKAIKAYEDVIARSKKDKDFLPEGRIDAIRLRLVNCHMRSGELQKAYDMNLKILKEKPLALDAQLKAAEILQSFGEQSEEKSVDFYRQALLGTMAGEDEKTKIWGWAKIASMLRRLFQKKPEYMSRYAAAQYHALECRRLYAMAHKGAQRNKELEKTARDLFTFSRVTDGISDTWWERFEELNTTIYKELKQKPKKLRENL